MLKECPNCKVSLIGGEIPEEDRGCYSPPYYWFRQLGIEDPMIYDGVIEWQCPDCKFRWPTEVGKLLKEPQ